MLMAPHDIPALFVEDYIKVRFLVDVAVNVTASSSAISSRFHNSTLFPNQLVGIDDGVPGFQKLLDMKGT